MKIYHYSPDSRLYLGSSNADESPLEPGVYLIPAHATAIEPPSAEEGQEVVWENGQWKSHDFPTDSTLNAPGEHPLPTWEDLRAQRNRLLFSSDWSQLPDAPLNKQEQTMWKNYRQTLRDLPEIFSDPTTIIWPEQPSTN